MESTAIGITGRWGKGTLPPFCFTNVKFNIKSRCKFNLEAGKKLVGEEEGVQVRQKNTMCEYINNQKVMAIVSICNRMKTSFLTF